jgi:hypothetical protein
MSCFACDDAVDAFVFRSRRRHKTEFAKPLPVGCWHSVLTRSCRDGVPTDLQPVIACCRTVASRYTWAMSILAEVEAVVSQFSAAELAELEQFVRQARFEKTRGEGRSALDLPPLDLGRMLQPLGIREQWYDEMLEERM